MCIGFQLDNTNIEMTHTFIVEERNTFYHSNLIQSKKSKSQLKLELHICSEPEEKKHLQKPNGGEGCVMQLPLRTL